MFRYLLFLLMAAGLAACSSGSSSALGNAGSGTMMPIASAPTAVHSEYRIGAGDQLNITVFQVEELTVEKTPVDAAGQIQMPLIGAVTAQGRTTSELGRDIAAKLGEKYLQDPQVSVTVAQAASQKVTVDGAVAEAGVFELQGRTTLLQAVAMAKGPRADANLERVAVFRNVNGQRHAAVFDLKAIRQGRSPDPEILGDDIVVVDSSALKGAWREVLRALPAFSIFRPF